MNIIQDLIPAGKGVRTGKKLTKCLGLVVHWIGVNQPSAGVIRGNFARSECGTQYISDWNTGDIIQCVPEDEVCYHVGGLSYTALKQKLCGSGNPNWYFVGIECCISPLDKPAGDYATAGKYMELGRPSDKQYAGLVDFAADFLNRHGLTGDSLYLHNDITNKACHVWFVKDRARWEKFKADVRAAMEGENDMMLYKWAKDVPDWALSSVAKAVKAGIIRLNDDGSMGVWEVNLQPLVWMDRAGLLG